MARVGNEALDVERSTNTAVVPGTTNTDESVAAAGAAAGAADSLASSISARAPNGWAVNAVTVGLRSTGGVTARFSTACKTAPRFFPMGRGLLAGSALCLPPDHMPPPAQLSAEL